jgi:hypothetical protein
MRYLKGVLEPTLRENREHELIQFSITTLWISASPIGWVYRLQSRYIQTQSVLSCLLHKRAGLLVDGGVGMIHLSWKPLCFLDQVHLLTLIHDLIMC